MRISVNAGHTAGGAGYGAVYKGFRESDITREVVAALLPKITIHCEAKAAPSGWHADWKQTDRPVIWGE